MSAALERVLMLEQENTEMRAELAKLAEMRADLTELVGLRAEVARLRPLVRAENESAFLKRLAEDRDELTLELRTLRERTTFQEFEIARLRRPSLNREALGVLDTLIALLRRK